MSSHILYRIIYYLAQGKTVFIDYRIFRTSFSYYAHGNPYEYDMFLYLPQFFIQFAWIPHISFNHGILVWFILYDICVTRTWYHVINDKEYSRVVIGIFCTIACISLRKEILVANTDVFILFFGYESYIQSYSQKKG